MFDLLVSTVQAATDAVAAIPPVVSPDIGLPSTGDPVIDQLGASAAIVLALQKLKRAEWFPWLDANTPKWIKRSIAFALAAATGLGITWSYDATAGDLTVHGLTLAAVTTSAWKVGRSFAVQQLLFRVIEPRAGE